jgi:hypothetical protein
MPLDDRNARRDAHLGQVPQREQAIVTRFLGTGPKEASERLDNLSASTSIPCKQSSLDAFLRYASALAGTAEDQPGQVWSIRKRLLEKAKELGLGLPG